MPIGLTGALYQLSITLFDFDYGGNGNLLKTPNSGFSFRVIFGY